MDFIKFSSGWVTEETGGDEGSPPLFAAFICLGSFILERGLESLGPRGEKVAPATSALLGRRASQELRDSVEVSEWKRD